MRRALLPAILAALLLAPGGKRLDAGPQAVPCSSRSCSILRTRTQQGSTAASISAVPKAPPVLAPAAGTVSFAGSVPSSGKSVTIETPDGYSVTLTHLGSISVARNAAVAEGAPVGTIGPSGDGEVPQPYVHLGVRLTAQAQGVSGSADPAAAAWCCAAGRSCARPEPCARFAAGPCVRAGSAARPNGRRCCAVDHADSADQAASPATVTPPDAATAAPSATVVAASAHARPGCRSTRRPRSGALRRAALRHRRAERRGTVRRGAGQQGAARLGVTNTASATNAAERSTPRIPPVLRTIAARRTRCAFWSQRTAVAHAAAGTSHGVPARHEAPTAARS